MFTHQRGACIRRHENQYGLDVISSLSHPQGSVLCPVPLESYSYDFYHSYKDDTQIIFSFPQADT